MGRTKNWDDSMHSIGQIILIRHAEKEKFDKNEAKGTDNGEDVENHLLKDRKEKNENLSYKGVCRAEFLATYFMEANKPFNTPDVLYAMQQKGPGSSNRPFQTIAPLARRLGVNVRMPQTREYVRDLVEEILYDSNPASTILICWEHKWLIPMANYFGIPAKAWSDSPLDKSSNDDRNYHTVWVITPLEEGLNFAVYHEPIEPAEWNGLVDMQPRLAQTFSWDEADRTYKHACEKKRKDWKDMLEQLPDDDKHISTLC